MKTCPTCKGVVSPAFKIKNGKVLSRAIDLLKEIDHEQIESVEIDHTKYDDGSVRLSVSVVFPAEKG